MAYVQYPKPAPKLARAEAERLLGLVIDRARKINQDPVRYPFGVKRILVFGSFLTDRPLLGDLDLGVDLILVRPAGDLVVERPEWRLIHWADRTCVALRLRRPKAISIHYADEVRRLSAPFQVVFENPGLKPPGQ